MSDVLSESEINDLLTVLNALNAEDEPSLTQNEIDGLFNSLSYNNLYDENKFDYMMSIDPALSTTGYAVFNTYEITEIGLGESDGDLETHIVYGTIYDSTGITSDHVPESCLDIYGKYHTDKNKFNNDLDRIKDIVGNLLLIAAKRHVKYIVLEDGYVGKNLKTAIQLSNLRGAIFGAFLALGYQVEFFQPSSIRYMLGVGGNASKETVARKVQSMFPHASASIGLYSDKQNKKKTSDIYDAISIGSAWLMNRYKGKDVDGDIT